MLIGGRDVRQRVLIVAEIGNNHEGDFGRARELVRRAAAAGVDAVKFQTFRAERFVRPQDTARFAQLKAFELSFDQFAELGQDARRAGLAVLSTPLDLESADFLIPHVDAFKVASGDNNFFPLLDRLAATGRPIVLSGGLATSQQLWASIERIRGVWWRGSVDPGLAVLHCVSAYPAPLEQANLGAIQRLRQELGVVVGYSDHTLGVEAAALSVAAGARIVEKHFTLDQRASTFRDHALSADPAEMSLLVQRIREIETLVGSGWKGVAACERENVRALRRAIVAARALCAGHLLGASDLLWQRPADGLPPGQEHVLLGGRLRVAVAAGQTLRPDMLEWPAPQDPPQPGARRASAEPPAVLHCATVET